MNANSSELIAIFDVGKTNSKLTLIDTHSGAEIWHTKRSNQNNQNWINQTSAMRTGVVRELDIVVIEQWLISALQAAPHKDRITTIVPVAHGATAVLMDADGNVLVAPDYEDSCYETVSAEYDALRNNFSTTFSPKLPLGLNLGRQWFYLQQRHAALFNRTAHLLLYPQYWAWRLSDVLSSEVTSLGCHTDLWQPQQATYSALACAQNWPSLLPGIRFAGDVLGNIKSSIANQTGLDANCKVLCGIHDSNASYLKFLQGREHQPFTVVSSGTWTVVMANGSDLSRLHEERDMLANVNVFGKPVATARYMGGREYEIISPQNIELISADADAVKSIINSNAMALPCFANAGPYANNKGSLVDVDHLNELERSTLATMYSVLMSATLVDSLAAGGDIFIDGPLARNSLFPPLLAACFPAQKIKLCKESGGSDAVECLVGLTGSDTSSRSASRIDQVKIVEPLQIAGFSDYRSAWQSKLK